MNACQSLPAALLLLATVISTLNGRWAHAQNEASVKESASSTEAIPVQDTIPGENLDKDLGPRLASEGEESNPFVPAMTPKAEAITVNGEVIPAQTDSPARVTISGKITQESAVVAEEIVTPIAEPVFVPTAPPAELSVPTVQPEIFFDSPAPSQSDRRISKDKVTELRQLRALYRANQRRARMEYNQWFGQAPLRPRWSPMPMMNSRYAPPTVIVPVFINPR